MATEREGRRAKAANAGDGKAKDPEERARGTAPAAPPTAAPTQPTLSEDDDYGAASGPPYRKGVAPAGKPIPVDQAKRGTSPAPPGKGQK